MAAWNTWGKTRGEPLLNFLFCEFNKRTARKPRGAPLCWILWTIFWWLVENAEVFGGNRTHHGSMVSSMFSLLWPHRAAFDHWCALRSLWCNVAVSNRVLFLPHRKPKDAFLLSRRYVVLFYATLASVGSNKAHYPGQTNFVWGIPPPEILDFPVEFIKGV